MVMPCGHAADFFRRLITLTPPLLSNARRHDTPLPMLLFANRSAARAPGRAARRHDYMPYCSLPRLPLTLIAPPAAAAPPLLPPRRQRRQLLPRHADSAAAAFLLPPRAFAAAVAAIFRRSAQFCRYSP